MQIEKQNRNLGTACSDTSGTDCSDSMVPITPLRVVPIQRYRQLKLAAEISSKTAEQRFDKFSNQLVKAAKHIYSEKATYHELTEGMRAWVLKKSDIKKEFHLNRTFFTHLNKGEHMLLSEFVRFTNWIFTHYDSEEDRLEALLEIDTVLFCHTKENADYGWHPFSRPLNQIIEDEIEKEVKKRVEKELRIRALKKAQDEIGKQ